MGGERKTASGDHKPTLISALLQRESAAKEMLEYVMVDAFTSNAYEGNQAAVIILSEERDEDWMQKVAAEFNVSQTAFVVKKGPDYSPGEGNGRDEQRSSDDEFSIRWFTPTREVPLCGHATLASAYVLFSSGLVDGDKIVFHSKSGELIARKIEDVSLRKGENTFIAQAGETLDFKVELNFPITEMTACDKAEIKTLVNTLRDVKVNSVWRTALDDLIVELSSTEEVQRLEPEKHELVQCSGRGLHVTAKAGENDGVDFASRCFFPKMNIDEDPVCGSAHCALTPFWAKKLGKDSLEAYQVCAKSSYRSGIKVDIFVSNPSAVWFLLNPFWGPLCTLSSWGVLSSGSYCGVWLLSQVFSRAKIKKSEISLESVIDDPLP